MDKWTEEVLLCGSWCPGTGDVDYISKPMPLKEALASMAICNSQMKLMGITYAYIVDCNGNILADKRL